MSSKIIGYEDKTIRTEKMLLLEQKFKRPIDELVVSAYNQYGFRGACEYLGITGRTLSSWAKKLDIVFYHGAGKKTQLEELGLEVGPRQEPVLESQP